MTNHIKLYNIITMGFMTFALFVGAGNIILPPMIGLQAGSYVWTAAIGFLITAVGLPILAIIALAKVGGNIDNLSIPIGKTVGMLLTTVCHLAVGPLFATPRTAIVSFEIGIEPLIGNKASLLFIYILIYFSIVILISLYPNNLLNIIGNFLAPLKIISLTILIITAVIYPVGPINNTQTIYKTSAFTNGFLSGYLTMDALGAMVFGTVIINTIRSRGITETYLLTRYTLWACLMTSIGLILLYLALFYLGSSSTTILTDQEVNGAVILYNYVHYIFGNIGSFLLATIIFLVCLVTAVGLTCACSEFLSQYLPFSYRILVFTLSSFSIFISNLGLNHLIQIFIPVLTTIYPPCIILIMLSFTHSWWNNASRVISTTMLIGLFFGLLDGIKVSMFSKILPNCIYNLPLSEQGLTWVIPTFFSLLLVVVWDRIIEWKNIR